MIEPRRYIVDGRWPTGGLDPGAPPVVFRLAHAAETLISYLDQRALSVEDLARRADVDATELAALLAGTVVPDLDMLARLEQATGEQLWR